MSYEEKLTLAYLFSTVLAFAGYLFWLLPQLFSSQPVAQIAYVGPMLTAIGIAIVLSIVVNTLLGMTKGIKSDERDREIERHSRSHSQFLTDLGAMAAVGMAMAKLEHFWIAHTVYVALVANAILGSVIKIAFYREGIEPD
jgi:hypothetical protein